VQKTRPTARIKVAQRTGRTTMPKRLERYTVSQSGYRRQ
jgi:hypothetical protein